MLLGDYWGIVQWLFLNLFLGFCFRHPCKVRLWSDTGKKESTWCFKGRIYSWNPGNIRKTGWDIPNSWEHSFLNICQGPLSLPFNSRLFLQVPANRELYWGSTPIEFFSRRIDASYNSSYFELLCSVLERQFERGNTLCFWKVWRLQRSELRWVWWLQIYFDSFI